MTAVVERIAGLTRLEHARAAAFSYSATLNDVTHLLELLSTAKLDDLAEHADKDVQRAIALGHLQSVLDCLTHSLRRFDVHTRCAPPDALQDLVAEALTSCGNELCENQVAPWDASTCSPECAAAYAWQVGER